LAFLDLSQVSDPDALEHAIAAALRLPEMSSESVLDLLVEMLRGRGWLLALDNCEQLVCGVVRVLNYLLPRCPDLRVPCTSREPLGMCDEVAWRVPPLSLPNDCDAQSVAQSEAVQLFVERARATVPRFRITRENGRDVAEICERLNGIPLAIELAAARLSALGIAQIAKRLDHLLELLTRGSTSAPPRHQSLRSSLDWSYRLLSKDGQRLFRRLAVFAGGWTIEAAESVGVGDPLDVRDVLDLLGQLVDKSLVQVDQTNAGHVRYRFIESHRQCAPERLGGCHAPDPVERLSTALE
jgi:predicted ATPase